MLEKLRKKNATLMAEKLLRKIKFGKTWQHGLN